MFLEPVPVRVSAIEFASVVLEEDDGEKGEKHIEKGPPLGNLIENCIIRHSDVDDLGSKLKCDP